MIIVNEAAYPANYLVTTRHSPPLPSLLNPSHLLFRLVLNFDGFWALYRRRRRRRRRWRWSFGGLDVTEK